jgi:hypothetical protein
VRVRVYGYVKAFETIDEEVIAFGGRYNANDGFRGFEGFEALTEHNIEVIGVDVG